MLAASSGWTAVPNVRVSAEYVDENKYQKAFLRFQFSHVVWDMGTVKDDTGGRGGLGQVYIV